MSWVCEESLGQHQPVPHELVQEAERLAKAALQEEMDQD
jgi:sulfur relay (sulfurtransferase) DsrF/TusC family protein